MRRHLLTLLLTLLLAACGGSGPSISAAEAEQLLAEGTAALEAEDYPRAEALLRRALRANPNDAEILATLGQALLSQQKLTEAATMLEQALEQGDDRDILFDLGVIRYEQGMVPEAIGFFEQARTLSPDDPELLYNLGSAYAQEQQFDTAIGLYQQATTISPTLPLPYFGLGTLYQATGDNQAAIEALNQFLALSDDPDLRQRAQAILAELQGE